MQRGNDFVPVYAEGVHGSPLLPNEIGLEIKELTRGSKRLLLLPAQNCDVLELDELWNFVRDKNVVWLWVPLCCRARQMLMWHFGPRNERSCLSWWEKILPDYKILLCYSDV